MIAVDATSFMFQLYYSGTIASSGCGIGMNHFVLAVGYGNYRGDDFILVKNSWGDDWGIDGYAQILATNDNICGILN